MKTTIAAITLAFLFSAFPLSGQILFGPSSGAAYSTVKLKNTTNSMSDQAYRLGWYGGVTTRTKLSEKISIGLTSMYSQKGYTVELRSTIPAINNEFRLIYLDNMIELRWEIYQGLQISGGGYFGLLLMEQYRPEDEDWFNITFLETVKKSDNGLVAGLHYEFFEFEINFRALFGLRHAANVDITDSNGQAAPDAILLNRAFQFGLSYFLNRREIEW